MLKVESHPQYRQILDWIAEGLDCPAIAAKLQPPLDQSTIWRYKRKRLAPIAQGNAAVVNELARNGLLREDIDASQAMQTVVGTSVQQLAAEPLLERIKAHQATIDGSLTDAVGAKKGKEVAALISADLKGLELMARLTGLLDSPQSAAVTNNWYIAMVAPPGAPQAEAGVPATPTGEQTIDCTIAKP